MWTIFQTKKFRCSFPAVSCGEHQTRFCVSLPAVIGGVHFNHRAADQYGKRHYSEAAVLHTEITRISVREHTQRFLYPVPAQYNNFVFRFCQAKHDAIFRHNSCFWVFCTWTWLLHLLFVKISVNKAKERIWIAACQMREIFCCSQLFLYWSDVNCSGSTLFSELVKSKKACWAIIRNHWKQNCFQSAVLAWDESSKGHLWV